MKKLILFSVFMLSTSVYADSQVNDWRKTGTDKQKLDNVVKVIPGASNIMLQMGQRYNNLYWAAKQEKWEFAQYQIEEMESLVKTLIITRPKRAATAKTFQATAFKLYPQAIEGKNKKKFFRAFEHMRNQCMICHSENDHAFIILSAKPSKGNSPVLD